MRVAVTGGTGFLGAHIAEQLTGNGHEAVCLVRPTSDRKHLDTLGVTQIPGSLTEVDRLERLVRDADAVIHAAGTVAASNRHGYHEANTTGTRNLLAACTKNPVETLIHVSSLAAKGPSPTPAPRPAGAKPHPLSDYGASKLGGESAVRDHARKHPVKTLIVRPPALYGPRDRGLLGLLKTARYGLYPVLVPPDAHFSMLYGPDCARLVVDQLGTSLPTHEVRILEPADGPPHTNDTVRASLAQALGTRPLRNLRIPAPLLTGSARLTGLMGRFTGRPAMLNPDKVRELRAKHWVADTSTVDAMTWQPRMDLTRGLRATHEWYEAEGWL